MIDKSVIHFKIIQFSIPCQSLRFEKRILSVCYFVSDRRPFFSRGPVAAETAVVEQLVEDRVGD